MLCATDGALPAFAQASAVSAQRGSRTCTVTQLAGDGLRADSGRPAGSGHRAWNCPAPWSSCTVRPGMVVPQSQTPRAPLPSCSIILTLAFALQASHCSPKGAHMAAETALQEGSPQKLLSSLPGQSLFAWPCFAGRDAAPRAISRPVLLKDRVDTG